MINLAVVLGGISPEREVSKMSGKAIYHALKDEKEFKIKLIDPAYGTKQPENTEDFFSEDKYEINQRNCIESVNSELFDDIDIAFIALHGDFGEDGKIQSLLETRGIKYTGSGVLSSALAMDKNMSKVMFKHYDVNTPNWILTGKNFNLKNLHERIEALIGFPYIVKPNVGGSTIGLTKCNSLDELPEALNLAMKYSDEVLIEEFIKGRELTAGIVNHEVFPVLEIKPKHELYDYECKYSDGMSEYIVPAEIDHVTEKKIKQQAYLAFNSLKCKNYARVDFLLSSKGLYCLEVNTLPGMTSHSLLPKMAKAQGYSFTSLLKKIIQNAIDE